MPVVTLLSDLGTRDATVSVAKATLLRYAPAATIIDLSHSVAHYDLQQAAYILLSAYRYFPVGTIHILLADVFAGPTHRVLLAEKEGYFFIAPDNGMLALAFGSDIDNIRLCYEFQPQLGFNDWMDAAGHVLETLLDGGDGIEKFEAYAIKRVQRLMAPKVMPDGVDCNILYIDRYENVVLDFTKRQFEQIIKDRPFRIKILRGEDITATSVNYNDVKRGGPLCRFNQAGFLEIAFNHAPAATLLGLGSFNAGNLRYRTIKIFFR